MNMKLGWWRDRNGQEHQIVKFDSQSVFPWKNHNGLGWGSDGMFDADRPHAMDLIEFLRPLESEIPPALNSAVKAAEDMVRRLERHHAALRNQANEAWEILTQAKRELERLEKECEVKL